MRKYSYIKMKIKLNPWFLPHGFHGKINRIQHTTGEWQGKYKPIGKIKEGGKCLVSMRVACQVGQYHTICSKFMIGVTKQ